MLAATAGAVVVSGLTLGIRPGTKGIRPDKVPVGGIRPDEPPEKTNPKGPPPQTSQPSGDPAGAHSDSPPVKPIE